MTVAEQLKQESEQRKQNMMTRHLLSAGSAIEFLAKMTGLAPEQVSILKAKNDKE